MTPPERETAAPFGSDAAPSSKEGAAFSFVRAFLFPGIFAALMLAGCASSPDVFTTYRRQAVKDFSTPEAQAYMQGFFPAIGADLATLLKKCTTDFPAEQTVSFELVFKVDHWGEPKAILVAPQTDVSTCVASGFFYFTFPHPAARFEKTGLVLLMPIKLK